VSAFRFPRATVIGVVDGDTIDVTIDYGFRLRQDHRVRLAGIDAPEVNAKGPEGEAARDWLRARLPAGTAVQLVTEKPADKFGRFLAWVSIDGQSVNDELVAAGHARPYDGGAR
jgi:endonuclease YncB( thermonuclease family)